MEPELVSFENLYRVTQFEDEGDKLEEIYIDGYPENEDGEGRVVTTIIQTKHGDVVVDWHDSYYRLQKEVLELIESSKKELKESYFKKVFEG